MKVIFATLPLFISCIFASIVNDEDIQHLAGNLPVNIAYSEELICEAARRGRERLILTIFEKGYIQPRFFEYNTAHTVLILTAREGQLAFIQKLASKYPLVKNQIGAILTEAASGNHYQMIENLMADTNFKVNLDHAGSLAINAVEKGDCELFRIALAFIHSKDDGFKYECVCIHVLKFGTLNGHFELIKFATETIDKTRLSTAVRGALEIAREEAQRQVENSMNLFKLLYTYNPVSI